MVRHQTYQLIYIASLAALCCLGCGARNGDASLKEFQRVKSGQLDIVLLSSHGAIQHGKDTFIIEFRSASAQPLDVGSVKVSASMPMPGMPMFGSIIVQPSGVPGRYTAISDFGMAGTWRMTVEWNGPSGTGSAAFAGTVQ